MKKQNHNLSNQVILVTGAGSGFGQAMAVAYCKAGAQVIGVGRRENKLKETQSLAGELFHPMVWDVTEVSRSYELIQQVVSRFKRIDVLVNNAATFEDKETSINEISLETWNKTLHTNVTSVFSLSQAAYNLMSKQKKGSIINVTSGLGFEAAAEFGSYCVSKAALNMLTRVFADESAEAGVLVNAIDPGVAKTEMNQWATESPDTINAVALHLASLKPSDGVNGICLNKKKEVVAW